MQFFDIHCLVLTGTGRTLPVRVWSNHGKVREIKYKGIFRTERYWQMTRTVEEDTLDKYTASLTFKSFSCFQMLNTLTAWTPDFLLGFRPAFLVSVVDMSLPAFYVDQLYTIIYRTTVEHGHNLEGAELVFRVCFQQTFFRSRCCSEWRSLFEKETSNLKGGIKSKCKQLASPTASHDVKDEPFARIRHAFKYDERIDNVLKPGVLYN